MKTFIIIYKISMIKENNTKINNNIFNLINQLN